MHGRIANIPAEKVSVFADWAGDEYVIKIAGEMRESVVFGENIALCYHCNFGYPLVKEGAKIENVPADIAEISAPIHGKEEECIPIRYSDDVVTVGIENDTLGAYITYERDTLPDFLVWKMLGESEYVVGLEPRTTSLGGQDLIDRHAYVVLKPFEEYKTKVRFEIKPMA